MAEKKHKDFSMISVKDIIQSLLIVSEKSARIARICRYDSHLLSLLIEEKKNDEKNSRFVRDFKTLADVLVQELIRYDLGKQFPEIKHCLYGEENNTFTNAHGESVTVILNESKSDTFNLLCQILNGDTKVATLLTESIHTVISITDVPTNILPMDCPNVNLNDLALWIDPIDSTTEYINGASDNSKSISLGGLNCVTVLIGMFSKVTGSSVIGVINQPFYSNVDGRWSGRCFWGISMQGFNSTSVCSSIVNTRSKPLIAISSCESYPNKKKLEEAGFELIAPAGAGYKILCVILSFVDAYVLSLGTTFLWDTCGCHAIIKGLNGNIWNYENALRGNFTEILYQQKNDLNDIKQYNNKYGFIACKDENLARKIISALQ